jgi:flavin reductase (DIM6/NTAB) family NADH-FMN oxidoreductase RutF
VTTQVDNDTRLLRNALAQFPAGVVALSATIQEERHVLVASSFSVGISEEPPLVLFSVQKTSTTWPKIKDASLIGVSVMGEAHAPVCRQLASRNPAERFNGIDTVPGKRDDLYISGSPLRLTCSIYREMDAGDHILVLMQIEEFQSDDSHMPLVFHRSTFNHLTVH